MTAAIAMFLFAAIALVLVAIDHYRQTHAPHHR